jgi:hypothetical protein
MAPSMLCPPSAAVASGIEFEETPLQLLDFLKLQTILSHFDGFFGVL